MVLFLVNHYNDIRFEVRTNELWLLYTANDIIQSTQPWVTLEFELYILKETDIKKDDRLWVNQWTWFCLVLHRLWNQIENVLTINHSIHYKTNTTFFCTVLLFGVMFWMFLVSRNLRHIFTVRFWIIIPLKLRLFADRAHARVTEFVYIYVSPEIVLILWLLCSPRYTAFVRNCNKPKW